MEILEDLQNGDADRDAAGASQKSKIPIFRASPANRGAAGDALRTAFQAARSQSHPSTLRRGHCRLSSNVSSPSPSNFTFMKLTSKKEQGKSAVSPFPFSLKRSGSVINRSISPRSSHSNPRTPSEPRRSMIMRLNTERNKEEEMELYSRKSKNLLKALFIIHRSKKEGVPSRFRDGR